MHLVTGKICCCFVDVLTHLMYWKKKTQQQTDLPVQTSLTDMSAEVGWAGGCQDWLSSDHCDLLFASWSLWRNRFCIANSSPGPQMRSHMALLWQTDLCFVSRMLWETHQTTKHEHIWDLIKNYMKKTTFDWYCNDSVRRENILFSAQGMRLAVSKLV